MFKKAFIELLIEKLLEHEKAKGGPCTCHNDCFCWDVRIMVASLEPDLLKEFEDQWEC